MVTTSREVQLGETFVRLADSLVRGFDVVDLLSTLVEECKNVLDIDEVGLLLVDAQGSLSIVAYTSKESADLEQLAVAENEGPCIDAFHSGAAVAVEDLERSFKWAVFRQAALDGGFHAIHSIPMRLRDQTIGALNLFSCKAGGLTSSDATVAQALADVATIAILQHRVAEERSLVASQLQSALDSRVLIEQAKGVLAHSAGISMDDAFSRLRQYARKTQTSLRDVAQTVVAGSSSTR